MDTICAISTNNNLKKKHEMTIFCTIIRFYVFYFNFNLYDKVFTHIHHLHKNPSAGLLFFFNRAFFLLYKKRSREDID